MPIALHFCVSRIAKIVLLLLASLVTAAAAAANQASQHPYREHWKRATVGKGALAGVAVKAGIGQVLHRPKNYGSGITGLGKRLGAGFATHAVKTTVEHAVAAPLHEDLHYHRSTKSGFGPRLRHALTSTVITTNTKSGKRRPAVGRLSGHAAAGAFSQAALHAGGGASTAGLGLAAEAGVNVAREFWPHHNSAQAAQFRKDRKP